MATAWQIIQGSQASFIEAANQPRNGFWGFPPGHFRSTHQVFSSFDGEQSDCPLMAAQTFTGSMTDAGEFVMFRVCERAEELGNGMRHTYWFWRILS
jgi:hypothetical protein